MTTVRSAKLKGSQFEYDCVHSLKKAYPQCNVYLTKELGFQKQYDICIEFDKSFKHFVECKRLKGISWNQLMNLHKKLKEVTADNIDNRRYILFQSNFQPCLVFYNNHKNIFRIETFKSYFHVGFEKHPSTRVKK